jgi:hypothetical protein
MNATSQIVSLLVRAPPAIKLRIAANFLFFVGAAPSPRRFSPAISSATIVGALAELGGHSRRGRRSNGVLSPDHGLRAVSRRFIKLATTKQGQGGSS